MSTAPIVSAPPAARPRVVRQPRSRWPRRLAWGVTLVALVAAAWVWRARAARPVLVAAQVVAAQRGTVRDFVTSVSAGRVSAKQEASLRADIAGKVHALYKHRGDRVLANEPILAYDADELEERLRLAQVSVEITRAQARQVEQSSATAESNLARGKRLGETGAISPAELEGLEGQAKVAARTVDAARASVAQAYANVELARTALSKAVVRAPFAGTILSTAVEVGEITVPGGPIAELADLSALHVDAELDEGDLGRVTVGMPADVTLDAFPGERVRGVVTEIAPSVTRDARGGRSVGVDVALPVDARLRVGMSADVDVIVAAHDNALFVPPNAVAGRGSERNVFLVTDGIAHKRAIQVGVSTWEAVEITSGLNDGDRVVASLSSNKIEDGVRVDYAKAP